MTTAPPRTEFAQDDPIQALLDGPTDGVLAIIAGIEGPSYRPVGAMMAVFSENARVGTLSSGCIEADIALQAMAARAEGTPRMVRYGLGSPFADIELPCGGGLDIVLLPQPNHTVLAALMAQRAQRQPCGLAVDLVTGDLNLSDAQQTECHDGVLRIKFAPEIRFLVFGKGPEASTFAGLVMAAGYPNLVLSPDRETLDGAARQGCATQHLLGQTFPAELAVDARTAIVLFFHDHDWEPAILGRALETEAFYIGAQGSQRARDARMGQLARLGVTARNLDRLHGPVGLIPSARDAGTLAVSVLAEVLAKAMAVENTST